VRHIIGEKPLNKRGCMLLIPGFWEKSSLSICVARFQPGMGISISCLSFACSAHLQFVPLQNKEASTVATALVDNVFLKYGLCHVLLSDQGLEFENEILQSISSIFGVTKIKTSSYRPQSNAICEVLHHVLNTMFAKCINENHKDWAVWLPYVTFCYNAAEHASTKFLPFFLYFGRMPVWSIDLALPKMQGSESVPEYAARVAEKLERVQNVARQNLNDAWSASCKWYNRKVKQVF